MPPVERFTTTRRNLPHWQAPGAVYFVTWRVLGQQVPGDEDRTIALDAIRFWDARKWFLYAAVVMPDHTHVLARPLLLDPDRLTEGPVHELGEVIASAKKFSARRINERHGWRGVLWQDERYDRIQRNEREMEESWRYIRNNPVTAGLVERPEDYPWLYEAKTMG